MSLARFGWSVQIAADRRGAAHPIVLNGAARYLLDRIWGVELLAGLPHHVLARRIILWRDRTPRRIDDAAIVLDMWALAERMAAHAAAAGVTSPERACAEPVSWTVVATGRAAAGGTSLSGGERVALVAPVATAAADPDALLIEAGERGWAALVPTDRNGGVLFACTPKTAASREDALADLLAGTHAVRRAVGAIDGPIAVFGAAPSLRSPLHSAPAAVFAGDAALAFDPLSGDGATVALRTAHLAASLAEAHARGTALEALMAFYSYRLARAMGVHVRGLLSLYAEAPFCQAWASELVAMRHMAAAVEALVSYAEAPSFVISEGGLGGFPEAP